MNRIIHRIISIGAIIGLVSVGATPAGADVLPMATATGTDTYMATFSPAIMSYVTDQIYRIKFINANTAQFDSGPEATINLNGLGPVTIKKIDFTGKSRLLTNDITPGHQALLWYDGTDMILLNPSVPASMAKTRIDGSYIGLVWGGMSWASNNTWDPVLYISSNAVNGNTRIDSSRPSISLALEGGYRQSDNGPILQEWNLDTMRVDGTPERWYGFANYDTNHSGEHGWWYRAPGTLSFRRYHRADTGWDEVGTFYDLGFKIWDNYRLAVGTGDDYFFRHDGNFFFLGTQYGKGTVFSVSNANPTLTLNMGIAHNYYETINNYTAVSTDDVIFVNSNNGSITITLPNPWPPVGKELIIKDNQGNAAINNIIVYAGPGRDIEGATSKVINTNWGSLKVMWNNTAVSWRVIP